MINDELCHGRSKVCGGHLHLSLKGAEGVMYQGHAWSRWKMGWIENPLKKTPGAQDLEAPFSDKCRPRSMAQRNVSAGHDSIEVCGRDAGRGHDASFKVALRIEVRVWPL